MGAPFAVSGIAAGFMTRSRGFMIPMGMLLAASVGFLMGPQTGVMAVACSSAMALCSRRKTTMHHAIAVTAGVSVLAAALPLYQSPVFMRISGDDMRPVAELYVDMGMERAMVDEVLSTMEYLAPGIGAIQIAIGSMAAVLLMNAVGWGRRFGVSGKFMMGWQMAWVLIACLAVKALPGPLPSLATRAADNVLLFMTLPYLLEGGAVALRWASAYPGMTVVLLIALVLATPVVLAAVALAGVLDTWFDFRRRIDLKRKGSTNEGPTDQNSG
jgi:hypothetical protein